MPYKTHTPLSFQDQRVTDTSSVDVRQTHQSTDTGCQPLNRRDSQGLCFFDAVLVLMLAPFAHVAFPRFLLGLVVRLPHFLAATPPDANVVEADSDDTEGEEVHRDLLLARFPTLFLLLPRAARVGGFGLLVGFASRLEPLSVLVDAIGAGHSGEGGQTSVNKGVVACFAFLLRVELG